MAVDCLIIRHSHIAFVDRLDRETDGEKDSSKGIDHDGRVASSSSEPHKQPTQYNFPRNRQHSIRETRIGSDTRSKEHYTVNTVAEEDVERSLAKSGGRMTRLEIRRYVETH